MITAALKALGDLFSPEFRSVLLKALGLTIALPRFLAGNGAACAVLGGEWLRGPETGKQACVFYAG